MLGRVAIYARYSSDRQSDRSIEDQVRLCEEYARQNRWTVVRVYSDHAISGATLARPGIGSLLEDAERGGFSVVVSEALDRLSRDQEDTAGLFKRLSFHSVKIVTLSEGEISDLHVGFKGTMNALFLKDLADKTRRGQRGRVEAGLIPGGLTYGYEMVRELDARGDIIRGQRRIRDDQATIVREIFADYASGKPTRQIVRELNERRIPSPRGGLWERLNRHWQSLKAKRYSE